MKQDTDMDVDDVWEDVDDSELLTALAGNLYIITITKWPKPNC